ncbi:MAG: hypothetical protein WAO20_07225 [Acidobacteriota bacterium]
MLTELALYVILTRRRRWSQERVRRRQDRLLQELVRHAFNNVPFYRRRYEAAGVHPEKVRGLDDLSELPVVRKPDIRRLEQEAPVLAAGVDRGKCRSVQTSGSTGIPLTIFFSRLEEARREAAFHRGMVDMIGRFWFRALRIGGIRPTRRRGPFGLNPRHLIRKTVTIEEAASAARQFKPHMITGLLSQVQLLALQLQRDGSWKHPVELVATGGETLLPPVRSLLEQVFRAPVGPYYGSWEFGLIAASCPSGQGYHVCTDDLVVECLKDGRPVAAGEEGEIVLTSLTSRVMPFIRYGIGDIGIPGEGRCPCGHPYARLEDVRGRSDDFLLRADGQTVSPHLASLPLYGLEDLRQFRITQETRRRFRVEYVSDQPLAGSDLENIRRYYAEELMADETILCRVLDIPPDPSGKLRKFISLVRGPAG